MIKTKIGGKTRLIKRTPGKVSLSDLVDGAVEDRGTQEEYENGSHGQGGYGHNGYHSER